MKFAAPAFEQRFVRRFLDQGMLEGVIGLGWSAVGVEQFNFGQLGQGEPQFAFRDRSKCAQKLIGEFAADNSGDLGKLSGSTETVKARHQRIGQRAGDLAGIRFRAVFKHRSGQFLDEQRYAPRPLDHRSHGFIGQHEVASDLG